VDDDENAYWKIPSPEKPVSENQSSLEQQKTDLKFHYIYRSSPENNSGNSENKPHEKN
jgi:hypothetical protein